MLRLGARGLYNLKKKKVEIIKKKTIDLCRSCTIHVSCNIMDWVFGGWVLKREISVYGYYNSVDVLPRPISTQDNWGIFAESRLRR